MFFFCPTCGAHQVQNDGRFVQFSCGEIGRFGSTNTVAGKCRNKGRELADELRHDDSYFVCVGVWGDDGSIHPLEPEPELTYREQIEARFALLELGI